MLKLKKVQILGFKSFCDRTEVQLSGEGIAAIVGPNGCGKSNISDAITWVLGEQSAKSLRGIKMEDVIFAGTRERKPTGMAEVSLTLVDPDVYDGHGLPDAADVVAIDSAHVSDWDETSLRQQRATETEEAVAEAQPGTVIGSEVAGEAMALATEADAETAETTGPNNVVLKIRRRKFGKAPVRAGELTITRRLFRSGDSEYLLNGKICRLRDIQDIFMGTGLGGESYAIIGQERIGQLLSSKPLDRRGIIEEAAGITRFKTKKRLAELRLEAAKQNLSRVNDIFEEVTKQLATLKRQAAKAERYGALREELRTKLRVVLASRMAQLDKEATAAAAEIARLGTAIDAQAAELETMDAEHTEGVRHGYTLDAQIREAGGAANQSAVELERITARTAANADRVAELTARIANGGEELESARLQLAQLAGEQEQHRSFLETATAESTGSREAAQARQQAAQNAIRALAQAEQQVENSRRQSMQLMQRAGQTRNEEAQAAAALAGLERESERLQGESEIARQELTQLGLERGQVRISFESVTERLKRLEAEIAELRLQIEANRAEESQSKRRGDQMRGEQATLTGRRNSLEALIREHSYSTDTVKNLFRAKPIAGAGELAPLGTLADFLDVEGKYEGIVDEFLRDELNFVVVKSWDAAGEGLRLLQKDVAGRATFLVHNEETPAGFVDGASGAAEVPTGEGVVALKDCIRVRNGFGRSLEVILPRLRDGFVAQDAEAARALALEYPQAFFLAPTGEIFHNVTVTGGRTRAQGPLALKRELNEVQQKVDAVAAELAATDTRTAALQHRIGELIASLDGKSHERRDAEREVANSGAALRQMDSETQRIERRLQDWQLTSERNRDARNQKTDLIAKLRQGAEALDAERATLEAGLTDLQQQLGELRTQRELLQQAAAEASAALAGLEERRRNAAANLEQTTRLYNTQNQRIQQLDQQITAAAGEKQRRETETAELAVQHEQLSETRATAVANGARLTGEATELRTKMTELDQRLRVLRHETEELRERRAGLTARAAKLSSDIEHIEATCINDLGTEAALLRADEAIVRIDGDALTTQEEESRALKQRLEAMGPVNMMALEEYNETAERHTFMEGQRKDLLESIDNTQASIKEIDDVSRIKFDEAFKVINDNFSVTFTKLFGGGQAFMKLTDAENSGESGIDIVASPPGKKLQNILLLSGGEKALTALSLLVGIFQFQPAPFCVLDEVDAPLDETNVGRFAKLIAEMSATTQFVVITHSKRTMSQADVIYGVTMQEPGVSKIVSVALGKGNRNEQENERGRRAVA